MITYAEFSASFGSGEAHGGCGGGKIETEATIFIPVREHLMSTGELWMRGKTEDRKEPSGRERGRDMLGGRAVREKSQAVCQAPPLFSRPLRL